MKRVREIKSPFTGRSILCLCLTVLLVMACLPLNGLAAEALSGGQEQTVVDPTGRGKGYSVVLYDNTNGLPTSEANAIAETSEGFIWIGSYSGLIRYDGNTFERFDSTTGIASVVSLFVDSKDRLWVGTNDGGVAVMEKGQFRMYNKADGLRSLSVRSIVEDRNGDIYIATTRGIARINPDMDLYPVDEPQINEEYIRTLKLGDDGVLYGVTMSGAVFTLQGGVLTGFYDSTRLGVKNVRAILPDGDHPGCVYLSGEGSRLYYGELQKGFQAAEAMEITPLEYVNSLERVGEMIWLCADNGIGLIKDGAFQTLDNAPINTSIEGMSVDYQGNLWFVSSQQGVMKIVPNQFEDLFEEYNLQDEVVYSTCLYHGQLFIGTKNSGLVVLEDGDIIRELPLKQSMTASGEPTPDFDLLQTLNGVKIRSIIRDSQNRLWISTFGETALMRYDGATMTRFSMEDGLPSNRVRTVYERKDGTFMVACTGGMALLEDDKVVRVYDGSVGINNTEILTVVEANNGDMFLGTDGGGIYRIRGDKVEHFDTGDGLFSDVVMRLKASPFQNVVWVVTSNSLAYVAEDGRITTIQKFPYSNNFDLYENSQEEMWVLSSNGVYVTPVEELLAGGELTPVFYSRDNGLPCITTANSYSELTEGGDLYISGTTGVAKVNIETPFESVSNIKMAVPYVMADGEYIYPDETGAFTVPSTVKKLTICSYVYTYSLTNPQVTYYLDGFEEQTTTVERSELVPVDYTNLVGGDYRFVMELRDSMGRDGTELSVFIEKQKSVGEMLWFRVLSMILGVLAVAAVVQLYFHRKTKALLKKQEQNKRLIREMVEAFAKTIDMKDEYTNGHSSRVAKYTAMLTRELGYDEETVENYYNIALLHDIGKIGIPSSVLNKPGKLTDEEYQIIQSHSSMGYEALKDISVMPELAIGAGAHHERPDGKGYPRGLKGEEIPRVAQIIAVADTFDAMYSNRPYRNRMNFDKVVSIIKEVSGTQLIPDVVDAFLRLVEKGELRDPEDHGGGTTEVIDNIRKRYDEDEKKAVEGGGAAGS